ncbi:MAG: hypothetical protein IPG53_04890 [Ignavibacteriales bacterium]|nr:hypothetical protein [Ignavibacteriales bacterium]
MSIRYRKSSQILGLMIQTYLNTTKFSVARRGNTRKIKCSLNSCFFNIVTDEPEHNCFGVVTSRRARLLKDKFSPMMVNEW